MSLSGLLSTQYALSLWQLGSREPNFGRFYQFRQTLNYECDFEFVLAHSYQSEINQIIVFTHRKTTVIWLVLPGLFYVDANMPTFSKFRCCATVCVCVCVCENVSWSNMLLSPHTSPTITTCLLTLWSGSQSRLPNQADQWEHTSMSQWVWCDTASPSSRHHKVYKLHG